jgi:hypothetical protein
MPLRKKVPYVSVFSPDAAYVMSMEVVGRGQGQTRIVSESGAMHLNLSMCFFGDM